MLERRSARALKLTHKANGLDWPNLAAGAPLVADLACSSTPYNLQPRYAQLQVGHGLTWELDSAPSFAMCC